MATGTRTRETRPVMVRGTRAGLRYRVHSTTEAAAPDATYVLVHGIGMSHRYLRRLHESLARTGHVHSIDLPGFGGTPRPERQLAVAEYADVIAHALERLGVTSCVLVGHSMGAQFVVEVARRRPSLAARLVLMGPVVDERRRTAWQQTARMAVEAMREPPNVNWIVFTDYLRCGPRWYLTELPVMLDYPIEHRIGTVSCPVLVMRGKRDPIALPPWCRRLAGAAPHGRLVEIPGAAHVAQHTRTEQVTAALRLFTAAPDGLGLPAGEE